MTKSSAASHYLVALLLIRDMCVNSCVAFTGPFLTCPECGEPCYDIKLAASNGKIKVARQEFHTMPIGPQLRALWRHRDSAERMWYRDIRTEQILAKVDRSDENEDTILQMSFITVTSQSNRSFVPSLSESFSHEFFTFTVCNRSGVVESKTLKVKKHPLVHYTSLLVLCSCVLQTLAMMSQVR